MFVEDIEFTKWQKKVDTFVFKIIGLNLTDLPDEDYRTAFDNGISAQRFAKRVIRNAVRDLSAMLQCV